MAKIGILIETDGDEVKATNFGVITAAAGNEIYGFVMDLDADTCKEVLGQYGVRKVVEIKSSGNLNADPDLKAAALADAMDHYGITMLLGLSSATGKDIMARMAAAKGAALAQDCVKVNIAEATAVKSHFAGKTFATLKLSGEMLLWGIRPNAVEPVEAPCDIQAETYSTDVQAGKVTIKEVKKSDAGKMDLTEANIIITGGRPIGSAENYGILEACADALGSAAVGASRAAVDAGYAPHSMQVGQTGKTVSPKLYIGCGLSGSVQHFAGMKTSKIIVAINTDKDAPIFGKCDYGIIGDMFEVVPALTQALKNG